MNNKVGNQTLRTALVAGGAGFADSFFLQFISLGIHWHHIYTASPISKTMIVMPGNMPSES